MKYHLVVIYRKEAWSVKSVIKEGLCRNSHIYSIIKQNMRTSNNYRTLLGIITILHITKDHIARALFFNCDITTYLNNIVLLITKGCLSAAQVNSFFKNSDMHTTPMHITTTFITKVYTVAMQYTF